MSAIGTNPVNNYQTWGAMPNYLQAQQQIQGQTQKPSVAISSPQGGRQVYDIPQTSLYNDPTKQSASGLNIYVFNPSGIGGPSTVNNYGQNPMQTPISSSPIANTPISKNEEKTSDAKPKKKKDVVMLTDDYIKTLESFLRSQENSVRKQGIAALIKRFEEDKTRYDNPSLTALLNIALQDPDAGNRMLALSVVASGGAHGDENTIALLNELKNSDKMFGQEAKMATNALLKAAQIKETIEDDSPDKPKNNNNDDEK